MTKRPIRLSVTKPWPSYMLMLSLAGSACVRARAHACARVYACVRTYERPDCVPAGLLADAHTYKDVNARAHRHTRTHMRTHGADMAYIELPEADRAVLRSRNNQVTDRVHAPVCAWVHVCEHVCMCVCMRACMHAHACACTYRIGLVMSVSSPICSAVRGFHSRMEKSHDAVINLQPNHDAVINLQPNLGSLLKSKALHTTSRCSIKICRPPIAFNRSGQYCFYCFGVIAVVRYPTSRRSLSGLLAQHFRTF